jgi:PAS domain S-box-containing protein
VYDGHRARIGAVLTSNTDPTIPVRMFGWFQVKDTGKTALDAWRECPRPPQPGGNMRDQHKSKHELTEETVGLRKQVDDLKTSIAARRRVEDALRESDELHRSLVDSLPTAVWCLDARGHLLTANRALAELLGYDSRSELLQLGAVLGIFADLEEEKRVLARLMSASPVRQLHARCRTKLGAGLPVAISAGTMSEVGDSAQRFVLVVEPVSGEQ